MKERIRKGQKLAKEVVMPTWAATKSLLLNLCSSQSHGQTNTEAIAPLFKTSPTDYATLHNVQLTQTGPSEQVFCILRLLPCTLLAKRLTEVASRDYGIQARR